MSFLPNTPFQAGEQVAVHALVGIGPGTPEKPVTTSSPSPTRPR